MLALRLARGSYPVVLLGRFLVVCAMAGVGFLLLAALSHALAHPRQSADSAVRLLWCLVPLAAAVQLAAAVARTAPEARTRAGLDAVGVGPAALPWLAAVSTAASCLLGSVLALAVYLHLRGDLAGLPLDGAAAELLAADRPLPLAAAVTLLCVAPLLASVTAALTTRTREVTRPRAAAPPAHHVPRAAAATRRGARAAAPPDEPSAFAAVASAARQTAATHTALPWGVALAAAGLALETYTSGRGTPVLLRSWESLAPGVALGWLFVGAGLVLAGPGLTYACGRLVAAGMPGALRLLSGRMLQEEAARIGRPVGALCAAAAGGLVAAHLHSAAPHGGTHFVAPLTVLGAALVVVCTSASALWAAVEARAARAATTGALVRLGASRWLLRRAVALRAVALLLVLAPLTWLVGALAALPLVR